MDDIKNCQEKLVCRVDPQKKVVEIVKKRIRTLITFHEDGTYSVEDFTYSEAS